MHPTASHRFLYKSLCILFIINLLFAAAGTAGQARAQSEPASSFAHNAIILQLDGSTSLTHDPRGQAGHPFKTSSPALDQALSSLGVKSVKPVFPPGQIRKLERAGGDVTALARTYRIKLAGPADIPAAVQALSDLPEVLFAEPDYIARAAETGVQATVGDPLYNVQWGLAKINIEGAWDATFGSPQVIIAVIDSGIEQAHIDLAPNLWVNPGEIADNGLDDDNNGYIDDVKGWNFVSGSNDVSDANGHGTQAAGVLGAAADTNGIAGVCPACRIMPVKVMQAETANYSSVAAGVLYAAQKGARVINLSLGGYSDSALLRNAIQAAIESYDVVIVAGAGNDNGSQLFYPAAYEGVLAVAGTQSDDIKVATSNYGDWVDVSAPGVAIRTTTLSSLGSWGDVSGTSFAAPFGAGLAGLLRSAHPTWNQFQVRSQITHTAADIDLTNPSYAGLLGSGRLDAAASMNAPHPILSLAGTSINDDPYGRPAAGATSTMQLALWNDWWDASGVVGTLSTADPLVSVIDGTVSFGDIPSGTERSGESSFSFSAGATGPNHAILFTLDLTDTNGYTESLSFTLLTQSNVVNKQGTIADPMNPEQHDFTWTSDNIYVITGNTNIAAGYTLTIQPGTTVKFNGDFSFTVHGALYADGTENLPIRFTSNTGGAWANLVFTDTSLDAAADGSGNYQSGSILRYVEIEDSAGGIDCNNATPFLSHLTLGSGGINCTLGATPLWLTDSSITGGAVFTGPGYAYGNNISGGLTISGAGEAEDNVIAGGLALGSGHARRNKLSRGSLEVGGSSGVIEDNSLAPGDLTAGSSFQVLNNDVKGAIVTGDASTVDHNAAYEGITVGSASTVTWNSVEGAPGAALTAGANLSAHHNRLVNSGSGIVASSGTIEYNLVSNHAGVGLQVGAAAVRYNSFVRNGGNAIVVQGGLPSIIEHNNFEGNSGTYDLQVLQSGSTPIPASNNWWGTTDSGIIIERVFDWYDDSLYPAVTLAPILTAPEQAAPAYITGINILPGSPLGVETGTFEVNFSRPMSAEENPTIEFADVNAGAWQSSGLPVMPGTLVNDPKEIAVDDQGTAWIAAARGLYAFDGVTWQAYGDPYIPTDSNQAAAVYSIAITPDGTKWAGTYQGLVKRSGETWTVYTETPSVAPYGILPIESVNWITVDRDGSLWFGDVVHATGKSYIMHIDGTDWEIFDSTSPGFPFGANISDMLIAPDGVKWMRVGGGVARFDGISWRTYTPAEIGLVNVLSMAIDQNGLLWAGGSSGGMESPSIASFDGQNWMTYPRLGPGWPWNPAVYSIQVDEDNVVWFALQVNGYTAAPLASFDGAHMRYYEAVDLGVPIHSANALAIDASGNKWIGLDATQTYAGGIAIQKVMPRYEVTVNPQWTSPSTFRASYDFTSLIPEASYRLDVSGGMGLDGMQAAPNSRQTFTVDILGAISDKTPPSTPQVIANGNGGLSQLSAEWSSSDAESSVVDYRYAIGITPGGREVVNWSTPITGTSMTHNGLLLSAGTSYYVSVQARDSGGLWSESGVSNPITAGATPPTSPSKTSPAHGAVDLPLTASLSWNPGSGATQYLYCLDMEAANNSACDSSWISAGSNHIVQPAGLQAGKTYAWQVRAQGPGGSADADAGSWFTFTTAHAILTLQAASQGANDGWILESTEGSSQGGTLNAALNTFNLGDDASDRQYRAILSFNTSALPDNAVITKVTIRVKRQSITGTNPFNTHGGLKVDIRKPYFGAAAGLAPADYQAVPSLAAAGSFSKTPLTGQWYSAVLGSSAWQFISRGGTTQFRLRFSIEDNDDRGIDLLRIYSGNADATLRPVLIIKYYVP